MSNIADDLAEAYFNGIIDGSRMFAERLEKMSYWDDDMPDYVLVDDIYNVLEEVEKGSAQE